MIISKRLKRDAINFFLCASTLLSTSAFSKNIYVATTGLDANEGTIDSPFATISKAATTSSAGDSIIIRGGTYNLSSQIAPSSGTSTGTITYKAYSGESVTINGGTGYCFSLQAKQYLAFERLKITTSNSAVGAGMIYMEGTIACTFTSCEFYGMPKENGSENTSVIRCMGTDPSANGGYSTNCVFRDNYFHDNQSPAMRLYDTKGWIIENNEFRNCAQAIGGKDMPTNMMVRRNLIVNCDDAFYFAGQAGADSVIITENIVVRAGVGFILGGLGTSGAFRKNFYVYNNAFYNCTAFLLGWDDGFTTNVNFWNNIVYSDTSYNIGAGADIAARIINMNKYGSTALMTTTNYSFDYNCIQIPSADISSWFIDGNKTAKSLSSWQTISGFETHSFSVNPQFVDVSAENFHLQAPSQCVQTGKTNLDVGAYPRGNDGSIVGRFTGNTAVQFKSRELLYPGQARRDILSGILTKDRYDILGRHLADGSKSIHISNIIVKTGNQHSQ
jgi:Right handed beta helix region